jgi:rod shape-determining protein MreC
LTAISPNVRRASTIAAALIIVSLLLILLDSQDRLDGPKSLLSNAVAPIGSAFSALGERASHVGEGGNPDLRAQLATVTADRDQLLAENTKLKGLESEVQQLRESLKFQNAHPELQYLTADVINRDPQSREKYVIINRGSNDGVQVGMAVVNPNFLVGQVTEVEPNRAKVLLVIDSGFQTGGRLLNARAEGIVYGRWQEGGRVEMRHLPYDVKVDTNDFVVTSGKTVGVPKDLVIGKVMEVHPDQAGNQTIIEVLPLVNFENLQTLTVITGVNTELAPPDENTAPTPADQEQGTPTP